MVDKNAEAYLTAMDELNVIMLEAYYAADPANRKKEVEDELFELLVDAYLMGIDHAGDMMDTILVMDGKQLDKAVEQKISGLDFRQRASQYVSNEDVGGLQRLAETEFHRVYNTAVADGIQQYVDDTGANVEKRWCTMRDLRVRETHESLEGRTVPYDSYFIASDFDQALYPGGFTNPENNVNCRCWLTYRRVNS